MRTQVYLTFLVILSVQAKCHGQGTLQITFDGPPAQPPDSQYAKTNYYESGMLFTGIAYTNGPLVYPGTFGRIGAASETNSPISIYPYDGSDYLDASLGDSLMFSFTNGSLFGLVSVDLAEYSTLFSNEPAMVPFFGYRQDGSTVTNIFTTDGFIDGTGPGADFQTFYFKNFTDLTRVEIPTFGWSLDNLVVSIPEPSAGVLLLLSGVALGALKWRNRPRA